MKKFGLATMAASALTAAILGLAGPAVAQAAVLPSSTTISAGIDHQTWLNDIGRPSVNVPQVDTSVHQSR
ncbi:MAG: hypothetical protein JST91_06275 [Actinobacteria bacterium]|nr:hypothetical protein [Actinomycetota bacterium]